MTETNVNEKSKLVILVGSVRQGRFGPTVASWVADRARERGEFDVEVVDLAELDIPLVLPALSAKAAGDDYPRPEAMQTVSRQLEAADAFIVVTPEYNHSYPASLKAMIDWHYHQWTAKPVAFVSYGAVAGGRHAVLHLENVFTELHAVTIRDGLSFPNYYLTWSDGQPQDGQAEVSAKAMLEQLAWWATVLRAARVAVPYPSGA
jgi:NAD(P)H-dependent FMN reductase